MDQQRIDGIYKYIIQDVLLPNKNVHLINLEKYNENGLYEVSDKGYKLRLPIESANDLINLMKPIFTVMKLIGTLGDYRQLNKYEKDFMSVIQSIEQGLIQKGLLLKEAYSDEGGILKEMDEVIKGHRNLKIAIPAIVDKSPSEKVFSISSENTSSVILYDKYKESMLPVGIGFVVVDEVGKELYKIFSFHTFNGLFNYLSSMIHISSPNELSDKPVEKGIIQEILRVNDFLKEVGVLELK